MFATSSVSLSDRWDWICNAICESYDWFSRDDLELVETDDGDIVTHRGEPIVEIHNCYLTNAARPLVPLLANDELTDQDYRIWRWDHERAYRNAESV